jgi:hypothetical protein
LEIGLPADRRGADLLVKAIDEADTIVENARQILAVHEDEFVLRGELIVLDYLRTETGHGDEQAAGGIDTTIDLIFEYCQISLNHARVAPAGLDEVSERLERECAIDLVEVGFVRAVVVELVTSEEVSEQALKGVAAPLFVAIAVQVDEPAVEVGNELATRFATCAGCRAGMATGSPLDLFRRDEDATACCEAAEVGNRPPPRREVGAAGSGASRFASAVMILCCTFRPRTPAWSRSSQMERRI